MKKIPTLFEREFQNHKVVGISDKVTPGMEWVLEGKGIATEKIDGACCAVIDGEFYKRYDAKRGKKAPEGAIPCCDPDPVTGHHPHWVQVDPHNPSDKWFQAAHDNTAFNVPSDGTYEAIGPHFNGNPYNLAYDSLVRHGTIEIDVGRSFSEIREYLRANVLEGIVFWLDGEPKCKIKRSDFGFLWPVEVANNEIT
jgi:hypothetical protein